ncbi:hypothetical protein PR202_gb26565 [Eleusine coracana subsp. coracana]|uniref:Aspergillus nuclease S1 n=1 Tax=Eleusine coracana subsp. coracana TaxID=191504 RepID=A0AAV5FRJ3_ELECO|nr:hypothetical protein PR202_gb26565 [Eleusine coracana subsp. coracana]
MERTKVVAIAAGRQPVSVSYVKPGLNRVYVFSTRCERDEPTNGRLSDAAAAAVKDLLPSYAGDDLSSLCSWADEIKFRYHWSSPLHYINTPDGLCNYNYDRDCKDEDGVAGRCVAGAINNYTSQLLTYGKSSESSKCNAPLVLQSSDFSTFLPSTDNLTQALLFLSHFIGDIHQPLHVGFTSDEGGNTIDVHWYRRKAVLHHVWDASIIQTAEDDFYGNGVADFIDTLNKNITVRDFGEINTCSYASESITAACDWAYKGVKEDSTLQDAYFSSRLPVVNLRLAQGGVRLAATLNRIFG